MPLTRLVFEGEVIKPLNGCNKLFFSQAGYLQLNRKPFPNEDRGENILLAACRCGGVYHGLLV